MKHPALLTVAICALASGAAHVGLNSMPSMNEVSAASQAPAPFDGEKTSWHGFDRYDFLMNEKDLSIKPHKAGANEKNAVVGQVKGYLRCIVVVPKEAAPGKP